MKLRQESLEYAKHARKNNLEEDKSAVQLLMCDIYETQTRESWVRRISFLLVCGIYEIQTKESWARRTCWIERVKLAGCLRNSSKAL